MARLKPIHPGKNLREEFMTPLRLNANKLALALHVPAPTIYDIVHEERVFPRKWLFDLVAFFGPRLIFGSIFIGIRLRMVRNQKQTTGWKWRPSAYSFHVGNLCQSCHTGVELCTHRKAAAMPTRNVNLTTSLTATWPRGSRAGVTKMQARLSARGCGLWNARNRNTRRNWPRCERPLTKATPAVLPRATRFGASERRSGFPDRRASRGSISFFAPR